MKQILPVLGLLLLAAPALGGAAAAGNAGAGKPLAQESNRSLLPLVMFGYTQAPGTITGRVFNAASQSRDSVSGAQVCYLDQCVTTGSDGMYTLENIPDGRRSLLSTAPEFYQTHEDVLVKPFVTVNRDIALTPLLELSDVFMRIVVTWNTTPTWPPDNTRNDMDAHLWMEMPNPPTHIPVGSDWGDCTTFPNACLESDYQTGYGPETMAIRQLESTTYYYGVLNYYAGYPGVPPITSSQAKVRVYLDNGVYYEFDVPTIGQGDFWYVFSMSSDGEAASLQEQNCITTYTGDIPTCSESSQGAVPLQLRGIK